MRVCVPAPRTLREGKRDGYLLRRTVPAAMGQEVEAAVTVQRCPKPAMRFADPDLPDSEY